MKINDTILAGVKLIGKDSLLAPAPLKDYIENESSLEDGVRVIIPTTPKKKGREVTLGFQVVGSTALEFETRKAALFAEFYKGTFKLSELGFTNDVFHLLYTGKSISYGQGLSGTACKVSAIFRENNPANRT